MRTPFVALLAGLLALGSPAHALMAGEFYVSTTGSDTTGDGSENAPWRTISHAMLQAGGGFESVIHVAPGRYDRANGELFPITVANGVTVLGPENRSALIDASGSPYGAFGVDIDGSAYLERLTVESVDSLYLIAGMVRSIRLEVTDCELRGGWFGIYVRPDTSAAKGTPTQFVASGNTILSPGGGGIVVSPGTNSATHVVEVTDNQVTAPSDDGIRVMTAQGTVLRGTVAGNVVNNALGDGIEVGGELNFLTGAEATFVLDGNQCTGCQDGIRVHGSSEIGAELELDVTLSGNTVTGSLQDGVVVELSASLSATTQLPTLFLDLTLDGNTLSGNDGNGLRLSLSASRRAVISASASIEFNAIAQNGDDGVRLEARGDQASVALHGSLHGNTVSANGGDGLDLSSSAGTGALGGVLLEFHAGEDAHTDPGLNTIEKNGDYAVLVDTAKGTETRVDMNWWGTDEYAKVEESIWDYDDDSTLGNVDYNAIGNEVMGFHTDRGDEWPAEPGDLVTVSAWSGGGFVPYAGDTIISLDINGLPVTSFSVSPAGLELLFDLPEGLNAGENWLTVTNPGGQTGGAPLWVADPDASGGGGGGTGGGGSSSRNPAIGGGAGCFLATAAYGDYASPELQLLRQWRDESLLGNRVGSGLVQGYYAVSPAFADAVAASPWAQAATRAALLPILGAVRLWVDAAWAYAALLALLAGRCVLRCRHAHTTTSN